MKLNRVRAALRAGVSSCQTEWSIARLEERDPRFTEVWKTVSSIPGWFEAVQAVAMFQVIVELRPSLIVEIGSYLGRSTVFFARSLQLLGIDGRVVAIDPHSGDRQQREDLGHADLPSYELFRVHVDAAGVGGLVDPIVATSSDAIKNWHDPFELLFVDGWHDYRAVLADGRNWIPHLTDGGVAIFDDSRQYADVRNAITTLHREGTMHLWGHFFEQAYAGRRADPPPVVVELLSADRPLTKYFAK